MSAPCSSATLRIQRELVDELLGVLRAAARHPAVAVADDAVAGGADAALHHVGSASPRRRGFETTQIGGGVCTGISGPISVPE